MVRGGLIDKKRLSRPAGTLLLCAWEEKRAVRGSGNEKPARETRKEISFGSGREKECRQTRRKPKCSHVSQKNRRLYAKTGLQREKVLCSALQLASRCNLQIYPVVAGHTTLQPSQCMQRTYPCSQSLQITYRYIASQPIQVLTHMPLQLT